MYHWQRRAVFALLAAAGPATTMAQVPPVPDSLRALETVVVSDAATLPPGVMRIPMGSVLARDPTSVADFARLIPSASTQTNSRGETLIYVRGSGERQLPLYFDGALLTVPWDRRIDAALVPAEAIGEIHVSGGAEAVRSGPNALAGAIELQPKQLERSGRLVEASASGGLPTQGRAGATFLRRRGQTSLLLSADGRASAGQATPRGAILPFGGAADGIRINTDQRALGFVGRVEHRLRPRLTVSGTLLSALAEKGVAPEGHVDPATESVRYWRYPLWSLTMGIANVRATLGQVRVRGTGWASAFRQDIDQYESAAFASVQQRQSDSDATLGGRLLTEVPIGAGTLVTHGMLLASTHDQAVGPLGATSASERFRETEASLAAEWIQLVTSRTRLTVGASVDVFTPNETAGRFPRSSFRALGGVLSMVHELAGGASVRFGASRKSRFPSMRELYGDALGRFALNPDLRPESAWLGEAELRLGSVDRSGSLVLFGRETDGAIEQERLPDGRRRRVNLGGSRALGAELTGAVRLAANVRADVAVTALHTRAWRGEETGLLLSERPNALGRAAIAFAPPRGFIGSVEAVFTGDAVSPGPDGLIDLPAALELSGRAGYRLPMQGGAFSEFFLRVDNALDATTLPQAGLPAPGRTVRAGVRFLHGLWGS